jgi:hypothetical protein
MNNAQNWYIVKQKDGTCQIVETQPQAIPAGQEYWGPLISEGEAIARRVGLIRAGKCQPL